ncbi:MAG: type II secretion system F family protein [Actinomycetota bacterium]
MTVGVILGLAVAVCGWLASSALAAARDARIRARLGASGERRPSPRITSGLSRLASRRGWPGRPETYALSLICSAIAGLVAGTRLAGPVGGLAGLAAGPIVIEGWLSRRRLAASTAAEGQLRETVLALAAGVRAGLSVRLALEEAARGAEPPLAPALHEALRDMAAGRSIDAALERLAGDLDLPDARLLVTALAVHRRTGGHLPVLLDELADVIGQRLEARRRTRALTAQGRASGVVLAALPVAFVALLSGTGGDGLGAFYRSRLGAGLLLSGLLLEILGFAWIRRIISSAETSR